MKQKGRCYWCERKIYMNKSGIDRQAPDTATLDHFIPRSQGGDNSFDNSVAACLDCNQRKSNQMPSTFLGITKEQSND